MKGGLVLHQVPKHSNSWRATVVALLETHAIGQVPGAVDFMNLRDRRAATRSLSEKGTPGGIVERVGGLSMNRERTV